MKRILLILLLTFIPLMPAQADIDWTRALIGLAEGYQAYNLTDEEVAQYAREAVKQMDKQATVCSAKSAYGKRLARLTAGMTRAGGVRLNFKVYKTRDLNAFACPDGSIRVFSALMDHMTDSELLGVIGHEIGHIALHHSRMALKSQLKRSAASHALGSVSSTWATLSDSEIGDITGALLSARFSRKQESAADDYGYNFLKKHRRNPWAMALVFIKLKKLSNSQATNSAQVNRFLALFSDHPDFDRRIANMSNRARRDGYKRPK